MAALCAEIARNYAIDEARAASRRRRDFVGPCEDADQLAPLHYGKEQRDPIDARRQLEVLASLFREGRMPVYGVDILEGVASRCTYLEIGEELGLTARAVQGRMETMRDAFRARMARLGMLPSMQPLGVIVALPRAIESLREAA